MRFTEILELKVSGWLRDAFHQQASLKIDPAALYSLGMQVIQKQISLRDLYVFLSYSAFGRGQTFRPDGQVAYRTYLSSQDSVFLMKDAIDTDFDNFVKNYTNRPFNQDEWAAYIRVIKNLSPNRIIIVRPPVSANMYAFENEDMADTVKLAGEIFKTLGLLYIDMNPNPYSSLDHSHIEWYDTDRVTADFLLSAKQWLLDNYGTN
jgi:hypothetical protein